jgi:hypothetical protein
MKKVLSASLWATLLLASCNASNTPTKEQPAAATPPAEKTAVSDVREGHWVGSFSNGMKGSKLSFDVKGNEMKDVIFEGYWYCNSLLELTTIGPEKSYTITGKKVDGTIKESGFYFELHGSFDGNKASGTLRFAFTGGGCDTYKLNWTAEKQ